MRLGRYPCVIMPGTRMAQAYGAEEVSERHRHRYEFNNEYRTALREAGLCWRAPRRTAGWWRLWRCRANGFM